MGFVCLFVCLFVCGSPPCFCLWEPPLFFSKQKDYHTMNTQQEPFRCPSIDSTMEIGGGRESDGPYSKRRYRNFEICSI